MTSWSYSAFSRDRQHAAAALLGSCSRRFEHVSETVEVRLQEQGGHSRALGSGVYLTQRIGRPSGVSKQDPLAKQAECQRRQPLGVGDDNLCKRVVACSRQLAVGERVQCCERASPQPMAESRVLDWSPTNRLGDIEHRQIALLVTLSRRDRLSVVRLDHVISLAHRGDFDLNSRQPTTEPSDDIWVPLVPYVDHVCADLLQHVSEQALRTKAELAVPDLGPQAAQYCRNARTINRYTQASAQRPGRMTSPEAHDTRRT